MIPGACVSRRTLGRTMVPTYTEQTTIARASRFGYLLGAVTALLASCGFLEAIRLGVRANVDWTCFAILDSLLGLDLLISVLIGLRAILPPELRADQTSLSLRAGLRVRRWSWTQIESFRIVRARDEFVAFNWIPDATRLKTKWLNYSFAEKPEDLLAILEQRLTVARDAGARRPASPADDLDAVEQDNARWERLNRQLKVVMSAQGLVFVAWLGVQLTSGTIMLTAIDESFKQAMIIAGACFGLLTPITVLRICNARRHQPFPIANQIILAFMVGSTFVAGFAGIGGSAAWTLANARTFSGSTAPFTRQSYPVLSFSEGKGGPEAEIDPFYTGERTFLPLFRADYYRFRALGHRYQESWLCYSLLTQKQGSAVRALSPGRGPRRREVLVPCDPRAQ